jgi:hypothetical protein
MVSSAAKTVNEYLASLPAERRDAIARVRAVVRDNLPPGFEEGMQYGMISWFVPLSRLAETYNGQPLALASLASQKQSMSLYLMGLYGDPDERARFEAAYRAAGKKLDMGKSCLRFRKVEDLPLDVIGDAISRIGVDRFVEHYEQSRAATRKKAPAEKRASAARRKQKKAGAKR